MSPEEFFAAKKKTAADLIEENVGEIYGLLSDGRAAEEIAGYLSAKLGAKITGANLRAKLRRIEAEAGKPDEDNILNRRMKAVQYINKKKQLVNYLLHDQVIDGVSHRLPESPALQQTRRHDDAPPVAPLPVSARPAEKGESDSRPSTTKKKPTIPDFDAGDDADKDAREWMEKTAREQIAKGIPASFRRSDE